MKKRIFMGIILCVMCCGLLVGCGSQSDIGKDVTVTVKVPTILLSPSIDEEVKSSYDFLVKVASAFEQEHKDENVKINVIQFDATDQTKEIDDCFDTENAADIFYADFFNSESYVYTGRVVPIDDIITDDIKSDIDDLFWNMCTFDGKTYMMPYLYRQNVLGYNKDMFRKCGLEEYLSDNDEVQNWTMDEWSDILETLKEKLPDNEYPLMMYSGSNQGDTHIMCYIRSHGSNFFDENGRFNLNTPEGIAGIQWIKDLEDKGYFPPNSDKLEIVDNSELFFNKQLAIYVVNNATESIYDFEVGYVNFPSDSGVVNTNFNTGFEIFDNGDESKIKVAKAFVKYIYESDWIDYSIGSIPCSEKVVEKYSDKLSGIQKYLNNPSTGIRFTGGSPNWIEVRQVFYTNIQKLLTGEYTAEKTAEMLDKECNEKIEEGYANSKLHN